MSLRLRSGEGCGNTLLLARTEDLRAAGVVEGSLPSFARQVCGSRWDGLLLLSEQNASGEVEARILNRDGSAGGTCLNGLRVAACADGGESGRFRMDERVIPWRRTGEGMFALELGSLREVRVRAIEVEGRSGLAVDFWNPHAVFQTQDLEAFPLAAFAAGCDARSDLFPNGVNVEIVHKITPDHLRMRVRERGVGETQACGSGAVAVALAAWSEGSASPLSLQMQGGSLQLARGANGVVELRGPASVSALEIMA